jgi:predicted FMN-binding regulatory protein PaiB
MVSDGPLGPGLTHYPDFFFGVFASKTLSFISHLLAAVGNYQQRRTNATKSISVFHRGHHYLSVTVPEGSYCANR